MLIAQRHGQDQKQTIGRQKTNRGAQLRKHAEPRTLAFRGVFSRQQRRATPFATQAQALTEAQNAEQNGRPSSNSGVTGQHTNQGAQQAANNNGFAALEIDPDGNLQLTRTENLANKLDFAIVDDNLEVTIYG